MSTVREQILQAVETALTNTTLAAERVFRSRVLALARDELPAIVVKPGDENIDSGGDAISAHALDIRIELYGKGDPADSLLDPVIESAYAAVMNDRTLGGIAEWIEPQGISEPDFDDFDDSTCMIVLKFSASFFTPSDDLSTHP